MRIPEFTASASLVESTSASYWTVGTATPVAPSVYPAVLHGCLANCLASQGDDPFAYHNCHCVCFGHPGKTCWLI
jgi:hypothetical protein